MLFDAWRHERQSGGGRDWRHVATAGHLAEAHRDGDVEREQEALVGGGDVLQKR